MRLLSMAKSARGLECRSFVCPGVTVNQGRSLSCFTPSNRLTPRCPAASLRRRLKRDEKEGESSQRTTYHDDDITTPFMSFLTILF